MDSCYDRQYSIPSFLQWSLNATGSSVTIPTHLLDVVVGESAAILELLSGEDKALLVWGNALLVLDLALHIVDGVRGLNLEGDGLAGDCEGVSMRRHLDVGAAASGVDLRVFTKICMVAVGVCVDVGCVVDVC